MNKERKVFVVFQCDRYLYVCSYVLMGVFGTKEKAIHAIMSPRKYKKYREDVAQGATESGQPYATVSGLSRVVRNSNTND